MRIADIEFEKGRVGAAQADLKTQAISIRRKSSVARLRRAVSLLPKQVECSARGADASFPYAAITAISGWAVELM